MAVMAEVFDGGQLFIEAWRLKDDTDAPADGVAMFAEGFLNGQTAIAGRGDWIGWRAVGREVEKDLALLWLDQGGENSEEGCFAAAIGA